VVTHCFYGQTMHTARIMWSAWSRMYRTRLASPAVINIHEMLTLFLFMRSWQTVRQGSDQSLGRFFVLARNYLLHSAISVVVYAHEPLHNMFGSSRVCLLSPLHYATTLGLPLKRIVCCLKGSSGPPAFVSMHYLEDGPETAIKICFAVFCICCVYWTFIRGNLVFVSLFCLRALFVDSSWAAIFTLRTD
jgi:hypothetical protein